MMNLTRQQLAAIAFVILLIAVVVLQFVPNEDANSLSARLEGAMGMAFMAMIGETIAKTKGGPTAMLTLLVFVLLVGCGGSTSAVDAEEPPAGANRELICEVTRTACAGCIVADQQFCPEDDDQTACVVTEE